MTPDVVVHAASSGCSSSGQSTGLRSLGSEAAARLSPSLRARFVGFVSATPDCWEWVGGRDDKGYGRFFVAKRPASLRAMKAHRLALMLLGVEIPRGMEVAHGCDNPRCVRPDHLSLSTHQDNMRQMAARGRGAVARNHRGEFARAS